MRIVLLALPLSLLLSRPSPAGAPVSRAPRHPAATCSWEPSGSISMAPGTSQTFVPNNGSACAGYTVTISPGDGTIGKGTAGPCSTFQWTVVSSGLFKVYACEAGDATITVSDGGTTLQTIGVTVEAP